MNETVVAIEIAEDVADLRRKLVDLETHLYTTKDIDKAGLVLDMIDHCDRIAAAANMYRESLAPNAAGNPLDNSGSDGM